MAVTNIQVTVVIKSRLYRESIAQYFATQSSIVLAGLYSSTTQLMPCLPRQAMDVIVLECTAGGLQSLVQKIKRSNCHTKVVIIVLDQDAELARECISAGVEGFVTDNDGMDDLYNCIINVHSGRISYPAEISRQIIYDVGLRQTPVKNNRLANITLTSRQTSVIELVENGFSNKEIARELGIELATVKNHVHQILERLNVKSRCEAVARFRKLQN